MLNVDQVKSAIRAVVMFVGGFVVAKGWVDNETLITIAGGIAAFAGVIWSMFFHKGANKAELIAVVKGEAPLAMEAKVDKAVGL